MEIKSRKIINYKPTKLRIAYATEKVRQTKEYQILHVILNIIWFIPYCFLYGLAFALVWLGDGADWVNDKIHDFKWWIENTYFKIKYKRRNK
jgi:hypothetical protein